MKLINSILKDIPGVGYEHHYETILSNVDANKSFITNSLKKLPLSEKVASGKPAIIVSAGPSLHKFGFLKQLKEVQDQFVIVAADGAYISCLRNEVFPDYLVSLDPHPTRIVRWFGDPYFEEHEANDDYFKRQDIDISFREASRKKNEENIKLVNEHSSKTTLLLCSATSEKVVKRAREAGFDIYWWHPLCDSPENPEGITRQIFNKIKLPCMNTGGTVGSAGWVFASQILKIPTIGVIGMDLGYHNETPYLNTQHYHELIRHLKIDENDVDGVIEEFFPKFTFPLTGESFYSDATYLWYRENLLQLMSLSDSKTYNCTQAGTLFGPQIECIHFSDFLTQFKR